MLGLELGVVLAVDVGEAPLLGDDDFLATGELVAGTAEGLDDDGLVALLGAHGKDDLPDVDTGDGAVGLAPRPTHASLQPVHSSMSCTVSQQGHARVRYTELRGEQHAPIGTGATQHLVDADDMEGVDTDTEMERVLSTRLCHVFVCADTGSLESLGRQLLVLVRDEVSAEGEVIDAGALAAQVEDADLRASALLIISIWPPAPARSTAKTNLGVGHTTVVPGLGVRLVLAVTVAASRSASHSC